MIWYSNPFSIEKNFGKAINDFCELVPDNDWIVIQDGDMMYLQPDFGVVIQNHINANKDFALMGCMTNRISMPSNCHNGQLSENHNILNHIEIAKTYSGTEVKECEVVAGFLMAFSKETWKKLGGFKENTHAFDSNFSLRARGLGLKIGIMQGLYVYHQYRPLSKNPRTDISHLK